MVDRALLTDTDFFRDLSEEDLAFLIPTCTVRTLRRGDLLFEEGDDCSELFVVSSGLESRSRRSQSTDASRWWPSWSGASLRRDYPLAHGRLVSC